MKPYVKTLIGALTVSTALFSTTAAYATDVSYVVQSGDTLWIISVKQGVSVDRIKSLNGLTSDMIYVGQKLYMVEAKVYTVKAGDTLWLISKNFGVTVDQIKQLNKLTSDMLYVGQQLKITDGALPKVSGTTTTTTTPTTTTTTPTSTTSTPTSTTTTTPTTTTTTDTTTPTQTTQPAPTTEPTTTPTPTPTSEPTPTPTTASSSEPIPTPGAIRPTAVSQWPTITYVVQAGDSGWSLSQKFGVPLSDLYRYNYMKTDEWFDAGQKIAINGFAPRNYDVFPGMHVAPSKYGVIADWFLDGQYVLNRNDQFQLTDVDSGKTVQVKMLGGYNHSDVEPLTTTDTQTMKELFTTWTWNPRAVVVWKDGMNIAASLSGMPHSYDTTPANGVDGHFDLYLKNSCPHGTATDAYQAQHAAMILKAAGK
ncbi:LysM peptidoglycan-binding domain-containing protein [Heliobacterium chlorum]|uniref:LysM peptidoglycan-binding domain-containing protein n=1 Tax=Heliobacterium chlorum TaxID=2698 RepID=A0ABR7SZC4_HELCL|nr:LysM peptidoglycan-binding domain-containing protein [Heliobacterium chlorum]MBC9783083.1 LysM peptidoglycan-binding domain-containing protein [Heliobacterium chlorum]